MSFNHISNAIDGLQLRSPYAYEDEHGYGHVHVHEDVHGDWACGPSL